MEKQQQGKTLYVILALVFAALIVGGATWFYVTGDKDTATAPEESSTQTSTAELQESVKTEVDDSLDELETQLAAIELDEESEDDAVDF